MKPTYPSDALDFDYSKHCSSNHPSNKYRPLCERRFHNAIQNNHNSTPGNDRGLNVEDFREAIIRRLGYSSNDLRKMKRCDLNELCQELKLEQVSLPVGSEYLSDSEMDIIYQKRNKPSQPDKSLKFDYRERCLRKHPSDKYRPECERRLQNACKNNHASRSGNQRGLNVPELRDTIRRRIDIPDSLRRRCDLNEICELHGLDRDAWPPSGQPPRPIHLDDTDTDIISIDQVEPIPTPKPTKPNPKGPSREPRPTPTPNAVPDQIDITPVDPRFRRRHQPKPFAMNPDNLPDAPHKRRPMLEMSDAIIRPGTPYKKPRPRLEDLRLPVSFCCDTETMRPLVEYIRDQQCSKRS